MHQKLVQILCGMNLLNDRGRLTKSDSIDHLLSVCRRAESNKCDDDHDKYDDIIEILMLGDGEYGCKTLVAQASEYHEAAQCHPHNFEPPNIIFLFTEPVVPALSTALDAANISSESLDHVLRGTSTLFCCSKIPSSASLSPSTQHCSRGLT